MTTYLWIQAIGIEMIVQHRDEVHINATFDERIGGGDGDTLRPTRSEMGNNEGDPTPSGI